MKIKICFISSNPNFLGGISLYLHNFIRYLKLIKFNADITWVYKGLNDSTYTKNNIKYVELKVTKLYPLDEIQFNQRVFSFLKKNDFDIINSHAIWGAWMKKYKKRDNQRLIHTYHGTAYFFFKNHLDRFNALKRILFSPLLSFSHDIELSPWKKADKIICVSEKVKKELESIYDKRTQVQMIRSGVDLRLFKLRNKSMARQRLKLKRDLIYGLYVGKGGYYTKGLDRVVKLAEELHKVNGKFRLIVIGPDKNKVKHLIDEPFIISLKNQPREKMPFYYNSCDVFFNLSRYEGGAPTLVTSEAMASGCLVVCSEDAKQEVIVNEKNGLIISENYKKAASRILDIFENKQKLKEILKREHKTVAELSLEKWGKKYLKVLLNQK